MYLHHGVKKCKNHGAKSICAMVLKWVDSIYTMALLSMQYGIFSNKN
jgi:hypothetical protein